MSEQLRRYRRSLPYSYSFGYFATLELLEHKPERARRVVVHSRLAADRRGALEGASQRAGLSVCEDDALVRRLAHKGNVYAFGVFEKYAAALEPGANHLLLLRPSDPGNLGSILRTAAAFEFGNVALVGEGLDPFNPHVVRASVGASFLVNSAVFPSLDAYRAAFAHRLYPFVLEAEQALHEASFSPPFTLVFGPEWPGLPADARRLGPGVSIPQSRAVESLGLPVAVAVTLYELRRRELSRAHNGPCRT